MNATALAEDAVSVRQVRSRGVPENALRLQLAIVATPRLRRFVFVRRVRLRSGPRQVAQAMQAALARLAAEHLQEVVAYADFPALVVGCARAALGSGLGTGWHWRMLGLPLGAGPGQAIATLLAAHPLEAVAAVAALADEGLLGPVWRDMPETAAARVTAALAMATGLSMPAWPVETLRVGPLAVAAFSAGPSVLLERVAAMWAQAGPLPRQSQALLAAAVLSLLRWSPGALRSQESPVWPLVLARLAGDADRVVAQVLPAVAESAEAEPEAALVAPVAETGARGHEVSTLWGGVLFLTNALRRLDVEAVLEAAGAEAPSGWRLLHDLGVAFGLPEDEPMAAFLAEQDLDTRVPPPLLAALMSRIEAMYRPDGPWPLPLVQPARLWATETHLDLDLEAVEVDLALRLSGLDLDPGWVPWLGRVVQFHYERFPAHYRGSH